MVGNPSSKGRRGLRSAVSSFSLGVAQMEDVWVDCRDIIGDCGGRKATAGERRSAAAVRVTLAVDDFIIK